jgi:predicted cupin superfamily sugar epimerase
LLPGGEWALLGTTVSPAFELGNRDKLLKLFPQFTNEIILFTNK